MGLVHVDVKALWALKRGLVIDPRPGLLGSLLWLCHFISLWASSSHMILAWMVWFLLDDRTRLLGNFGLVGRPQEFWPWRQSEPCIELKCLVVLLYWIGFCLNQQWTLTCMPNFQPNPSVQLVLDIMIRWTNRPLVVCPTENYGWW